MLMARCQPARIVRAARMRGISEASEGCQRVAQRGRKKRNPGGPGFSLNTKRGLEGDAATVRAKGSAMLRRTGYNGATTSVRLYNDATAMGGDECVTNGDARAMRCGDASVRVRCYFDTTPLLLPILAIERYDDHYAGSGFCESFMNFVNLVTMHRRADALG